MRAIVSMLARMTFEMDLAAGQRLQQFFYGDIGQHLLRPEQKASFATYAFGLLSDGERKSVEPMASRATGSKHECQNMHDRLLHFVGDSPWDDRAVRREAARYVTSTLAARESVTTWIIDDTGFPKKGRHSVGVTRQYCGQLGKQDNCQVAVSLSLANRDASPPVAYRLYLPEDWAKDQDLRHTRLRYRRRSPSKPSRRSLLSRSRQPARRVCRRGWC